jgi:hypothetical protein
VGLKVFLQVKGKGCQVGFRGPGGDEETIGDGRVLPQIDADAIHSFFGVQKGFNTLTQL